MVLGLVDYAVYRVMFGSILSFSVLQSRICQYHQTNSLSLADSFLRDLEQVAE